MLSVCVITSYSIHYTKLYDDEATRELTQRSRQVVEGVARVHKVAESNASRTAELDQVVETLDRLTKSLEAEVGTFKI